MGLISIETRSAGAYVEIRIQDSGGGIPEDIRTRIFDPFFTTKEIGKGTGQGLAIARSVVVDKHQGSIDVETESGRGTTFIIRLPCEAAQTVPPSKVAA
jgi:two-component system NtrC family sensor kinase